MCQALLIILEIEATNIMEIIFEKEKTNSKNPVVIKAKINAETENLCHGIWPH